MMVINSNYDLEMISIPIKGYESAYDASRKTGLSRSSLANACRRTDHPVDSYGGMRSD